MSRFSSRTARLAVTAGLVTALAVGGSATALARVATAEPSTTASAPAGDQAPVSPEAYSAETEPTATPSALEQSKPAAPETDAKPDAKPDASADARETGAFTANGKGFDTFADAVAEAAKASDKTVTVNASTSEGLTVAQGNDDITVTAAEGVELRGQLAIKAKDVTVKDVHFVLDDQSEATKSVAAGNGTTVTGCTFDITGTRAGQLNAIWAAYVSDLTFEGNTFNIAVNVQDNSWVGINLVGKGVKNVKINDNTLNGLPPVNETWNQNKAPNLFLVIANGNVKDEGSYGIENLTATGNKTFDKTGVAQPNTLVYGISFNNVNGATFTDNAFEGYMGFAFTGWPNQASSKGVNISNNTLDTQVGIRLRDQDVQKGELKLKDNTFGENTQQKYDTNFSVADQDGKTYASLADALDAGATKVTLLGDQNLDKPLTIKQKVTLDGAGFGINGKLILADGASGSTIENTHFIQNGRNNFSGGFASSLQLSGADDVTITNNTFTIDKDAKVTSGRAVAVYVQPDSGEIVANTIISNNTFDLTDNKDENGYLYAILLTNEVNGGTNPGVLNTIISGNTLKGQASLARTRFLSTYDTAATPRVGVKGVTVTDNTLAAEEGSTTNLLMDFWGGTGDITIQGNTFGAGDMGVLFRAQRFQQNKQTAPQENVVIKGNTFNSKNAVIDGGGLKQEGGLVAYGVGQTGADANKFGADTTPFAGTTADATLFYGVTYRETDGTLLAWEIVSENGKVNPDNVPSKRGYTVSWYKDKDLKEPFDTAKDTVTGNLTLYPKWHRINGGGGTVTPTPKTYTVTFVDNLSYTTDQTAKVTSGSKVTKPADPTLKGYEFKGWFADAALKEAYDFDKPVTGDLKLYAKWGYPVTDPKTFTDVEQGAWYVPGIDFVTSHGLMQGYAGTSEFGVGKPLTRGQLVVILQNFAAPGYGPENAADAKNETNMPDVADGQYYTSAVNWAYENGVVSGYDNGDGTFTFGADDPVTMEQMVTILARFADKDGVAKADQSVLDKFKDPTAVSDWAKPSVAWSVERGVINGSDEWDGFYLRPTGSIMRERVATVLMNAFQKGVLNF